MLTWRESTENPEALSVFGSEEPSLDRVTISRIVLDYAGPTATFSILLNDFPAAPPTRWLARGKHFNAVMLELQAIGIKETGINGWNTDNVVAISIARSSDGLLRLEAKGTELEISMSMAWLRIIGLTPYQRGKTEGSSINT